MAAYLIADMEVTDAELLAQFSNRIGALVEAHNGRYLVRRGIIEVVESDRTHDRVVVIEFGDLGKARAFVNSPGVPGACEDPLAEHHLQHDHLRWGIRVGALGGDRGRPAVVPRLRVACKLKILLAICTGGPS